MRSQRRQSLARKHLYRNVLDLVTVEREQISLDKLVQFRAYEPSEAITLYRLWESGLLFRSANYGFAYAAFTSRNRADQQGFGLSE